MRASSATIPTLFKEMRIRPRPLEGMSEAGRSRTAQLLDFRAMQARWALRFLFDRARRSPSFEILDLLAQSRIAVVPLGADRPLLHRRPYGASRFDAMRAIPKAALVDVRAEFAKAFVEVLRGESPHPDFAKTGRIDHISRVRKRVKECAYGSMPSLVDGLADLADTQVEPRVHRVHQRRLADARRSGKH